MAEMQVYALKVADEWAEDIYASLRKGVGRFGWSYMKDDSGNPLGDADLKRLKSKIDMHGWESLTKDEQSRYQAFLLQLKEGDWVVYINVPQFGQCTVARVTGPYYWEHTDEDFNHRFSVDPESVRDFDRNDEVVQPYLSQRLKLQGRYWRIYALDEFNALLESLVAGAKPQQRTAQSNASLLSHEIEPLLQRITEKIYRTHPNYGLEQLLELVFKNIPGVRKVSWQGGAGDHGADLIVEFEGGLPHPALQTQHTCVIQAKSYTGEQWDTRAVNDIRRAFEHYPAADMGLIVSTAASSTRTLDEAIAELRETSGKRVELLIGADVARFILRFGGSILA